LDVVTKEKNSGKKGENEKIDYDLKGLFVYP
jgi:hypothetical protein